jgi:hypothetical protein
MSNVALGHSFTILRLGCRNLRLLSASGFAGRALARNRAHRACKGGLGLPVTTPRASEPAPLSGGTRSRVPRRIDIAKTGTKLRRE